MGATVCVPIHGNEYEQMFPRFKEVANRYVPGVNVVAHHYTPPNRYKCPAHGGDWGKAEATSIYTKDGPVLIMDVDSVLVYPIKWAPKNKDAVFSISGCDTLNMDERGVQLVNTVAREAGLLGPEEGYVVNPQFFWATENLLPLYEELDSIYYDYNMRYSPGDYMWSLTTWTLVWLTLRKQGKIEPLIVDDRPAAPAWHCPMVNPRVDAYNKFADWMMKQPLDNPQQPPPEMFGIAP